MLARYNSIGFKGLNGAQTFVTLATPKGEVRAYLTSDPQKSVLSSHNIGKTFKIALSSFRQNGFHQEADLLSVQPV